MSSHSYSKLCSAERQAAETSDSSSRNLSAALLHCPHLLSLLCLRAAHATPTSSPHLTSHPVCLPACLCLITKDSQTERGSAAVGGERKRNGGELGTGPGQNQGGVGWGWGCVQKEEKERLHRPRSEREWRDRSSLGSRLGPKNRRKLRDKERAGDQRRGGENGGMKGGKREGLGRDARRAWQKGL